MVPLLAGILIGNVIYSRFGLGTFRFIKKLVESSYSRKQDDASNQKEIPGLRYEGKISSLPYKGE